MQKGGDGELSPGQSNTGEEEVFSVGMIHPVVVWVEAAVIVALLPYFLSSNHRRIAVEER